MNMLDMWITSEVNYHIGFDEKARIYYDFANGIKDLTLEGIEPVLWTV